MRKIVLIILLTLIGFSFLSFANSEDKKTNETELNLDALLLILIDGTNTAFYFVRELKGIDFDIITTTNKIHIFRAFLHELLGLLAAEYYANKEVVIDDAVKTSVIPKGSIVHNKK